MKEQKTAIEQLTSVAYDGKVITDSRNRKIKLRKPNIMDQYYLRRALGDDASNPQCVSLMWPVIYVAALGDGENGEIRVIETPKTFLECEVVLRRLGEEGAFAIMEEISKEMLHGEGIDEVKKS